MQAEASKELSGRLVAGLPRKLPLPGPRQESAYHDNYIGKTNGTDTGHTLKRSRTKMYCSVNPQHS